MMVVWVEEAEEEGRGGTELVPSFNLFILFSLEREGGPSGDKEGGEGFFLVGSEMIGSAF